MTSCQLILLLFISVSFFIACESTDICGSATRANRWRWNACKSRESRRRSNRNNQPNIIYIMADDLGWNDVGFHNELINTPHIDWLARNGIELTDYHSEPICTPSRAALLTGKYPSRVGMQQLVMQERSKQCLPTSLKLLPEMMKENGYTTKMVGKWHLGYCNVTCLPTRRGFDEFRGFLDGRADFFTWESNEMVPRYIGEEPNVDNIGTHISSQNRRDVEEMIMSHRNVDSPLFMYIAPLAPHDPLVVTDGMFNRHPFLDASDPQQNGRRRFLGLVSALDDLVGTTISALRRANLYENSVIVFTSDNGGQSSEISFRDFVSFGNNYPLRGSKGELFEGGHRAPTIYHTPRLPRSVRGTKRNFLMHITDWLPTFVQMANPRYRLDDLDGVSQLSNLMPMDYQEDPYRVRDGHLVLLTEFNSAETLCSDRDSAYRWRDWKLIYGGLAGVGTAGSWTRPIESPNSPEITGDSCSKTDENGELFVGCLFNMKDDPLEQHDLYNGRPDIVKMLKAKIENAKSRQVANVFRLPEPISPVTTTTLNGVVVPITGYCNPQVDSAIRPVDPSCNL